MNVLKSGGNTLLASLGDDSLEALTGLFEPIALPIGYQCATADQTIGDIYFPTRGVIARHICQNATTCIDAGLFGREGFSGIPLLFGIDRSPHEEIVRVAGEALRAPAAKFIDLIRQDTSLRGLLLRFAHCLALQASCSALSNRNEVINRLSRLLVMCHDRIDGHGLCLTHGFLATTLGVRRASVTSAMHHLEGDRLIKATRGRVEVRDRQALETIAGASYGVAEREYDRLIVGKDVPESAIPA